MVRIVKAAAPAKSDSHMLVKMRGQNKELINPKESIHTLWIFLFPFLL